VLTALAESLDIRTMVRERRVIVCCGAGGVGKTTSAAALGVLAAREGRSAVVMTIDPAKRLAQAMGLDELDNDPQPVTLRAPGSLHAMMLDTKRTFDRMVDTYAPDERVRETIFANQYYQQLSSTLGGSRELIAMERVLEILTTEEHDLLIVDTPPAQHALDFLEAPQRLIDLLDGSFTQLLVAPYGVAARAQFNFFRQSSAVMLKFLERLTGLEMLADLSNFLLAFSSMFEGVKERSSKVLSLMSEPTTTFLLICAPEPVSLRQAGQFAQRLDRDICAPEPVSLRQAGQFAQRLDRDGMDISGVLINRMHLPPTVADLSSADRARLAGLSSPGHLPLAERVAAALTDAHRLGAADLRALAVLDELDQPQRLVPHFNRDLHSMEDLVAFSDQLCAFGW
jgi:anion-transporting  ArsA/GET3 family ATPase